MWQKIKFFFLRRLSDEKLRMWCVEMTLGFSVDIKKAQELYDFITDKKEPSEHKS